MLSARRRTGFTLVELLIVIVILAVVLTSVMTIFVQQQRFYSDSSAIIETRSSTRDAAYVLQSDLRALSPKSGDIYKMGSGFVEFRSQPGSSVVCTIDPTRTLSLEASRIARQRSSRRSPLGSSHPSCATPRRSLRRVPPGRRRAGARSP